MMTRDRCIRMRWRAPIALPMLLLLACSADPQPVHTEVLPGLEVGACLADLEAAIAPAAARCPGMLVAELSSALQICSEVGGQLLAAEPPEVWSLDVNADGRPELAFELNGLVVCENAWSVFSCGSQSCPKTLYEQRDGEWAAIASLYADSPEVIELVPGTNTDGYRDLRIGCSFEQPCREYWQYVWRDGSYVREGLEVQGHYVEFENSLHGLFPLVADTDILSTPTPDAAVVTRHPAGTHVAVVGTAADADYYYVSPCNACASGFVRPGALRVP